MIALVLLVIIITEDSHVQQHLHIVFFPLTRNIRRRVTGYERSFPRLLLYEHTHVQLQEIHTALQAQHLADKRRLHNNLVFVEMLNEFRQLFSYRMVYIPSLIFSLYMKRRWQVSSQNTECILPIEPLCAFHVGKMLITQFLIQKLTCQLAQENGSRNLRR